MSKRQEYLSNGMMSVDSWMEGFHLQEIGIHACRILVVILAFVYLYRIRQVSYVIAPTVIQEQFAEVSVCIVAREFVFSSMVTESICYQ